MADEDDDDQEAPPPDEDMDLDDEEDGEPKPRRKLGKKMLFIIIGVAVVVVLIATGGGLYWFGILDSLLGIEHTTAEDADAEGQVFYKMEDITLNLRTDAKKSKFLKIGLTLVLVHEKDIPVIEALQPRIIDGVVNYLAELRAEEISGSANFHRMRENLLLRVQVAVAPVRVTNVLFNSVLVQ